jgi:outer membrane protein TolC
MTDLLPYIAPLVGLAGLMLTIWWRVEGKIEAAAKRAEEVEKELAAHKLHTAETYITKQGLRETTDQIMGAIGGVKAAVENMTLRVDRIVENQGKTPRTTRAS